MRTPRAVAALLAAVVVSGTFAACAVEPAAGPPATTAVRAAAPVDYSGPGPYPVGTVTIPISDLPCPADPVEAFGCPRSAVVFYPADPTSAGGTTKLTGYSSVLAFPDTLRTIVPTELIQEVRFESDVFEGPDANREGPFPVVLHSHDVGGYFRFESVTLAHLASWGFVVAAPDHQERSLAGTLGGNGSRVGADVDDLVRTAEVLRTTNVAPGPLHGAMNPATLAVTGHGAGAAAALHLAGRGGVAAVVGVMPVLGDEVGGGAGRDAGGGGTGAGEAGVPVLLVAGAQDGIVALDQVRSSFARLASPKELVVLAGAGHNTVTDLCRPIRDRGGLSQYAARLPALSDLFRTQEDGCTPDRSDPRAVAAFVEHVTVAQLRARFGFDRSGAAVGGPFLQDRFGSLVASVDAEP